MLSAVNPEKSKRMMQAMMPMGKIDIEELKQAHEQR